MEDIDSKTMQEIRRAKIKLYRLIISVKNPTKKLTKNEIDIGYYLSQDSDIQKFLDDALNLQKRKT